jgi:predicted ATPase/DNA-binding CsgD family transcriptional regulator
MTGTGGIGKTRLALACAFATLDVFTHGAHFVSLASVTNSDFVLPTLIQTLALKEQNNLTPLASLKCFLYNKQLLLLLDNFEHVINVAPLLLDLLQSCPNLKLLVTSRAVLHMPGEHIFLVPPLAVPDLRHSTEHELTTNASLRLFVERARALKPRFQVTASNALLLAKICYRLEGLPLALELAAARITLLSPQQLLTRLSHRLDLLSQTGNAVPKRQQTIRQTLQWSYELLNEQEQQLLCRLSIFAEGCRLSDIEAFYRRLGDDPAWIIDGIASLLDKSLIFQYASEGSESRLSLLETIREFGLEILSASGQLERTRVAHAEHYASLVPMPEAAQIGLAQGEWLEFLQREYKNMVAALHFFQENQKLEQTLQLAVGIGGIWFVHGYGNEGMEEMAHILALCQQNPASISPTSHAFALALAAGIAIYSADFPQAQRWHWANLPLCRTLENSALLALTIAGITLVETDLGNYAKVETLLDETIAELRQSEEQAVLPRLLVISSVVWLHRGRLERARANAEASIQLARTMSGQEWSLACALHLCGWVAYLQGAWATAYAFGQESVALLRQLSFPVFALEALCLFAYETAAIGETETAQALFTEALTLSQEAGDTAEIGRALCGLGYLALRHHNLAEATRMFEDSIKTMLQIKQLVTRFIDIPASSLEGLAMIACTQRQTIQAARLLGAADTLRHTWSYENLLGKEAPFWELTRNTTMKELGEEAFSRAFAEGKCLTPLQALSKQVLEKRAEEQGLLSPANSARENVPSMSQPDEHLPFGEHLTRREVEVLRLLAQGMTNAQIADNLMLRVFTINSYLRSVYSKLNVSSRAGATRYALDHHLI